MGDSRKAGIALMAGTFGSLLTMALHPVATGGTMTPAQLDRLAWLSGLAHSLAIASFLLMFMGACGLVRCLNDFARERRAGSLPFAGLVLYGFACVAILIATSISGFIMPTLLRHMVHDGAAYDATWRIVLDALFQFNQSFARIYSVAVCCAILLWSAWALRHGGLSRALALYGCVHAAVLMVLVGVGHLRLNVHGMLAVVIAHALWFMPVGAQLYRAQGPGGLATAS